MLRTLYFVHENPCFSGQTLSFLHFVHEKCRFSGQKLLFFVHQKYFSRPLSVVCLLNLPSSVSTNFSLPRSETKFYWGAYAPRVFFKTAFGRSSLNLQHSSFEQSSLFQSELKFYWGAYSPNPLGRYAPKNISVWSASSDCVTLPR